jgi:uncharacterized protein YaeQ
MALTSTLYDFDVTLSHVDRNLHLSLAVRTARHPSETLDRVWLRVLAYLWLYEERLAFGPGLSDPDAPDLRADDLTGATTLWVRVGRLDPSKLQREADRAGRARVVAFFDAPQRLEAFLDAARAAALPRLGRVELVAVDPGLLAALAARDDRRSKLVVTVSDDHLYLERAGEALDGPLLVRRPA